MKNQIDWFLGQLWRERFEALARKDMERWTELCALIDKVDEVPKDKAVVDKVVD